MGKKSFRGIAINPKKEQHPVKDLAAFTNIVQIEEISLNAIQPNPDQPRQTFPKESLNSLASSIKEKGVLQPILVHRTGEGGYQIIVGERRWRASQLAGKETIPAIVKETKDTEEISLIENIHRENLNPVEESCAIEKLIAKKSYSQSEVAVHLSKHKSYISQAVKIAEFAKQFGEKDLASVKMANDSGLTRAHLVQVAYEHSYEKGVDLLKQIVKHNLKTKEVKKEQKRTDKKFTSTVALKQILFLRKTIDKSFEIEKLAEIDLGKNKDTVTKELRSTIETLKETQKRAEAVYEKLSKN